MNILKKYKYRLNNLDCANCANKIEERLKKENNLSDVVVNFSSLTLSFMSNDYIKIEDISNIVTKIEPEVVVTKIDEEAKETKKNYNLIRLIIGVIIALFGLYINFNNEIINKILIIASYVILLYRTFKVAVKMLIKSHTINENALITISSIGAYFVDKQMEGLMVITLYEIGKILEEKAVNNSRNSIKDLMNIKQDFANKVVGDKTEVISVEDVKINDILIIKKGEKIPVDGIVIEGETKLNLFSLTGESDLVNKKENDEVLSGSINEGKVIKIKATKLFNDSTVSKILSLIEDATDKKSKTETFVAKMAKYYTPIVVILAACLAFIPPFVTGMEFSSSIYRALVFLVVSCPCALVVSIPLGFFGGIGGASKNGILVKGGNYLEALNNVETVVFDKTGTLTKGTFNVTKINVENGFDKDILMEYAVAAESFSSHPIATSIIKAYGKEIEKKNVKNYEEISGHGIKVSYKDKVVLAGNKKLMNKENIVCKEEETVGTVVYIAIDNMYVGNIIISDEIKEDTKVAIKELKKIGVKKTVMLTGDNKKVGEGIGKLVNIDEVYSELLPYEKVEKLEKIENEKSKNKKVIYVGDGINDAPVLARADIGIAMGGVGSDAAIEAADVIIMTDEPSKIVSSIKIAKRTRNIVIQNIAFAIGVKVIILIFGALGMANMWEAVFGDVGVALIAVLNAMRALKVNKL